MRGSTAPVGRCGGSEPPSSRALRPLPAVTAGIKFNFAKINLSQVFAGQAAGITQAGNRIGLDSVVKKSGAVCVLIDLGRIACLE